jgi:indolepyruvate ferredoxin oxidoreductase alpha subunit
MLPVVARKHRKAMVARLSKIKDATDSLHYNHLELVEGAKFGIIASGISYAYTMEALSWLGLRDKVSILKIGTPYPLPEKLIKEFIGSVPEVLVVEELEPFVENHIKVIAQETGVNVDIHGKDFLPVVGELSTRKIIVAVCKLTGAAAPRDFDVIDSLFAEVSPLLPLRPPSLCAGCPHRASHYVINAAVEQIKRETGIEPIRPGDIGCYCLGANEPLNAVDTSTCMGSGFDMAGGMARVLDVPIVAHLGDSTFFHSGIGPMVNAVFNKTRMTMVVLDNLTTAMTGSQPNPGAGSNACSSKAPQIRPEDLARAAGVKFVEVVDPCDLKNSIETMIKAIKFEGPSMVVFRRPCSILEQREKRARGEISVPYRIDRTKCLQKSPPFCTAACPLHIDVRGYVKLAGEGKYTGALKLIKEQLPFPAILGRICTHPCENKCKRGEVDDSIAIMALKRAAADYGKTEEEPAPAGEKKEKVAIVGGGPAGMMAAYDLRKLDYQVTIFEAAPVLGGMLALGIPEYRLPRNVLHDEISLIQKLGVDIKLNMKIGSDIKISQRKISGCVYCYRSSSS